MGFNFLSEKAARKYGQRVEVVNKKLEGLNNLEKPKEDWSIKIDLPTGRSKKVAFDVKGLFKSFDNLTVIKNFTNTFYSDEKVVLIGKNGSGKTTLLKVLYGEIKEYKGEVKRNDTIKIGYLSQDHLEINTEKTIIRDFLDDEKAEESEARKYLHKFLFKDDEAYRKISSFSQGEKAKYAFAKMLYYKPTFLLLDEPTNYMDIESKEIIENALKNYDGGLIIATHDRSLIESIAPKEIIDMVKA